MIKKHIEFLAVDLGERNYIQYQNLKRAQDYIKEEFRSYGYILKEQVYSLGNQDFENIIATKIGKDKKDKIIIICAHYDSAYGSPGADDNASGVAGILELARLISSQDLDKTIKFIAFCNEEPPFYMSTDMGSFRYAKNASKMKEDIEAVLCLESIGFYQDKRNSQTYPLFLHFFYPDKGNFIAMVSNFKSGHLLKKIVKEFRSASSFPIEYLVAPLSLVPAIGLSDNWSFWHFGYKAIMITDTAFYRNPYYHSPQDTLDKLDCQKIALLIEGLYKVILNLAR
ncbi:MAG: M28 family peptidase [Candidatus Omnitrophica bacterium]|nr:M28 family peptidase [Candidatus Omnitrophota bacterium]